VFWTLGEILRPVLYCPDILKFESLDEVIHGFDFLANRIEECDIELWYGEFQRNTWKTSSRPYIEKSNWRGSMFDNLTHDTDAIERIYKMLENNPLPISDGGQIGM
jgi:hypothetical protein